MLTRKMQDNTLLFYDGSQQVFSVRETEADGGWVLFLEGSLRSDAAYHIQDELDAFTTVGSRVTLDFEKVTYAAASVLDGLLNVQMNIDFLRKGGLLLRKLPKAVYQVMSQAGIDELLEIDE